MSEATQPDAIKNLAKFLVCLAILGTMLALATYFGLILPSQQAPVHPPTNLYMQVF